MSNEEILLEAKKKFIKTQYIETIAFLNKHNKTDFGHLQFRYHDIRAASQFMLFQFEEAQKQYTRMIELAPGLLECQICYIASVISYRRDYDQLAISTLHKLRKRIAQPTIHYLLKEIAGAQRKPEEAEAQNGLIQKIQHFNPQYCIYNGLVPHFLKPSNETSDYIYKLQKQLFRLLQNCVPQNWEEHLSQILDKITERENANYKLGILYEDNLDKVLQNAKLLINLILGQEIPIPILKERVMNKFIKAFKNITKCREVDSSVNFQAGILELETEIERVKFKKEVNYFHNPQLYAQETEKVYTSDLHEWNFCEGASPEICTASISKGVLSVYVQAAFMRKVNPRNLSSLLKSRSDYQSKQMHNLYWMIILKIMLNSVAGYDLQKFISIKEALQVLICEGDEKEKEEEIRVLFQTCVTVNRFFQKGLLSEDKLLQIYQNFEILKKYIDEVDETLTEFLEKEQNIAALFESVDMEEATYFRKKEGIEGNLLAENIITIIYHFRCKAKKHELLKLALKEMTEETPKFYSGKKSLFIHYEQKFNPKGILKKIWNTISQ